jgi:hypothetical protein
MKHRIVFIVLTLLLTSLLFAFTFAFATPANLQAQPDSPTELFSTPVSFNGRTNGSVRTDSVRTRVAAIDWDGLAGSATRSGTRLTLNLFDDAVFVAQTRSREAHLFVEDGYTWVADIAGDPYSEAILTVANGHVEGFVNAGGALYRITMAANGLTEIRELNNTARQFTDGVLTRPRPTTGRGIDSPATCIPSTVSYTIDVMVVYTPASRDNFGGTNAIINGIHGMVAAANLSYERSGVYQRLRLVHIAQTNYTASGNAYLDLQRLTNSNSNGSVITGNDGFMDDVPVLRNTHNADVVTAIIEINQPNGVAWQMLDFDAIPNSPFAQFAYSVIGSNLIVGGMGYAHELGHTMGNTHNPEDTFTFGVCVDSFGYRDPGNFRTIMSYNCVGAVAPCPLIPRWSDPNARYNNRPLGSAIANEAKTLNFTASIVAAFRNSSVSQPPTAIPPIVANDWWSTPATFNAIPFSATQDIVGATISGDFAQSCTTGTRNNGVWYTYQPTSDQSLILNTTGSAYDTVLSVHTIRNSALATIACNDDVSAGLITRSALALEVNVGISYLIQVTAKSATPIVTPTTMQLNILPAAATNVNLIANGNFDLSTPTNPELPASWGIFATPSNAQMEYRLSNGVFEFLRKTTATSAVVLQNTTAILPTNAPIEVRMQLGNSSANRKRITVLAHAADFSDLQVCTFWLEPNAPLRQYVMRTFTNVPWMPAAVSIYASVADGIGWYQVDDVSLRYIPTLAITSTQCIDPTAPPAATFDTSELLANGNFSSGLTNWGLFSSPGPTYDDDMVYRVQSGVFEYYRRIRAGINNSAVILQDSSDPITAGTALEARFSLANNSTFRKRITILLHANDFSDLQVCTFWIPPNTNLAQYTMRAYATRNWASAVISFYASTADDAPWARIDTVSLRRLSNVTLTGTACYIGGASPIIDSRTDAPIPPTLYPTATALPYSPAGVAPEMPLIMPTLAPIPPSDGEGTTTE